MLSVSSTQTLMSVRVKKTLVTRTRSVPTQLEVTCVGVSGALRAMAGIVWVRTSKKRKVQVQVY